MPAGKADYGTCHSGGAYYCSQAEMRQTRKPREPRHDWWILRASGPVALHLALRLSRLPRSLPPKPQTIFSFTNVPTSLIEKSILRRQTPCGLAQFLATNRGPNGSFRQIQPHCRNFKQIRTRSRPCFHMPCGRLLTLVASINSPSAQTRPCCNILSLDACANADVRASNLSSSSCGSSAVDQVKLSVLLLPPELLASLPCSKKRHGSRASRPSPQYGEVVSRPVPNRRLQLNREECHRVLDAQNAQSLTYQTRAGFLQKTADEAGPPKLPCTPLYQTSDLLCGRAPYRDTGD